MGAVTRLANPAAASVAVVGAGPVGMATAIDLAQRGIQVVLLDAGSGDCEGSKAICWSKRTLEIFDRLGVGAPMLAKGVTWKVGRIYHGDRELYSFDLQREAGCKFPAFVNLQQYYVERYLHQRVSELDDLIDVRMNSKVTGLRQQDAAVQLQIDGDRGSYELKCDWVVAADGSRSTLRSLLKLELVGRRFEERFLISDVEIPGGDFPSERRFWFEPTFHGGQSALLHRQPDDIYRIDLQLGPDADAQHERSEQNVMPRIERVLGARKFRLDWVSVYSFQCSRLERFVHGRVIFAGDSAHVVSPFGARGGNSGIQDADNLGWKLAAVVRGTAPAALLETYNAERCFAADENIGHSARTSLFMSPAAGMAKTLRDEILRLAAHEPSVRPLINAGRLSTPVSFAGQPDMLADDPDCTGPLAPGAPLQDAPALGDNGAWLTDRLRGNFLLLAFGRELDTGAGIDQLVVNGSGTQHAESVADPSGLLAQRYGGKPGTAYLFRPDGHVAARFAQADADRVGEAVLRIMSA